MKKFIFLVPCFISIICLSLFLFLFLGPSNPNANYNQNSQTGSDSSDNQTPDSSVVFYQIIFSNNEDYIVSLSKSSAMLGETIYIKIEIINNEKCIKEVFANDIKCKEIEHSNYNYYFNMPNENVTLNIKTENVNGEIEENKILWDENNTNSLIKSNENDTSILKFNFLYPEEITSIQKQISIISTNQECIPNTAIYDISLIFLSNGLVSGITFKINLLLINNGTTTILINVLTTNSILLSNEFNLNVQEESLEQNNEIKIKFKFLSIKEYPIFLDIYNLKNSEYLKYEIFNDEYLLSINIETGCSLIFDIYYIENSILNTLHIDDTTNDFYSITNNEITIYQNNIIISLDVYNEK